MISYILKRLLWVVPVLLGVSLIVFIGVRLAPGDPAQLLLGSYATEASLEQLRTQLGLDGPIILQYFFWLSDIIHGDFGRSITHHEDVLSLVLIKLIPTMYLAIGSLVIAIPLGLAMGITSAVKHNTWIDRTLMLFPLAGISLPIFWLGILLILLFSQALGWFPSSGMYSPTDGGFIDLLKHLVLPSITLSLVPSSVIARMMRSSMLEVIRQDYIRTARAKGCQPWQIIFQHAVKNSFIPVVTVMGMQVGYVIGGAVVVETVFSWPGVGHMLMQAILTRDFPLVIGGSLVLAFIFVFTNLIIDILYGVIDPRIEIK